MINTRREDLERKSLLKEYLDRNVRWTDPDLKSNLKNQQNEND